MKDKEQFRPDFLMIPIVIVSSQELEPSDRLVYGVIYWYQKLKEGKCIASNKSIAYVAGVHAKTVGHSLERLENAGFIERFYQDATKMERTEIKALVTFKPHRERADTPPSVGGPPPPRTGGQKKNSIEKNSKGYSVDAFASKQSFGGGDTDIRGRLEQPPSTLDAAVPEIESAVAPAGGRRLTDEPYVIETPLQKTVCAWKKLTGFDPTDRAWDRAHWGRHAKTAAGLMAFLDGHINAIDCCQDIYEAMTKKGLTCTMETVLKHSADWKLKQQEGIQ